MRIQKLLMFATIIFNATGFIHFIMIRSRRDVLTHMGIVAENMHSNTIRLGFVGDVMIGRGIDTILPSSVDSTLHESYMKDANGYVRIAVRENGPLSKAELEDKGHRYIWGDVADELESSDALIINLETTLTQSNDWNRDKGIHYKSHPSNVASLSAIGVKVATLANNHVLDWGEEGLKETISVLDLAGINYSGAGSNVNIAKRPTFFKIDVDPTSPKGRSVTIAIQAIGFPSAGVPIEWQARKNKCGVNFAEDLSEEVAKTAFDAVEKRAAELGKVPDIIIFSLHIGSNWNWGIPLKWRIFAHKLIDLGADVVVGHSSHHVKGMEVYKNKFISYGLGDFLNDYEGIVGQGYEDFRNDLSALYLPVIDLQTKKLLKVDIIPCKIKHLKVQRATDSSDIAWLKSTFNREGEGLGTSCEIENTASGHNNLKLIW